MRRVITQTVCDITGEEGAETVHVGLDGCDYQVDLAPALKVRLEQELAPFIAAARRVAGRYTPGATVGRTRTRTRSSAPGRAERDALRDWWEANQGRLNLPPVKRGAGRIPDAVKDAYRNR